MSKMQHDRGGRRAAGPGRRGRLGAVGLDRWPRPGVTGRRAGAAAPAAERKVLYWYDPMVPTQRFDKPGKSPFMDMQLVPRYADEGDDPGRRARGQRFAAGPAVAGRAAGHGRARAPSAAPSRRWPRCSSTSAT